jgi:hypothetical protein
MPDPSLVMTNVGSVIATAVAVEKALHAAADQRSNRARSIRVAQ